MIRVHNHIDTGIDSERESFFAVCSDAFAGIEIVNVGPVGYDEAVPVLLLLGPYCKIFVA